MSVAIQNALNNLNSALDKLDAAAGESMQKKWETQKIDGPQAPNVNTTLFASKLDSTIAKVEKLLQES